MRRLMAVVAVVLAVGATITGGGCDDTPPDPTDPTIAPVGSGPGYSCGPGSMCPWGPGY